MQYVLSTTKKRAKAERRNHADHRLAGSSNEQAPPFPAQQAEATTASRTSGEKAPSGEAIAREDTENPMNQYELLAGRVSVLLPRAATSENDAIVWRSVRDAALRDLDDLQYQLEKTIVAVEAEREQLQGVGTEQEFRARYGLLPDRDSSDWITEGF